MRDPVVDLADAGRIHADGRFQPVRQVFAHRNVALHQRLDCAPQQVVLAVCAVQVEDIASMLAVDSPSASDEKGGNLPLQCGQVPRVHHVGTQLPQCFPKAPIKAEAVT